MVKNRPSRRSAGRLLAIGTGLTAASYAFCAGMTCYRHGRLARPRNPQEEDALLDRFMPVYEAAERHHCRVAAPQGLHWRENQSPLQEEGGLDASHHSGISRRGVEKCFFLTSSLIG